MSDVTNSTTNQAFNVREDENLASQVARVIIILMPRAFMAAGYDIDGQLLTVRRSDYTTNHTPWILDFYENHFLYEPLLANTRKVIAAFVANEHSVLVPAELYDEKEATTWLKNMYFIESNEAVSAHLLETEQVYYISAYPAALKSLVWRYFPARKVMPLATYQFQRAAQMADLMHCCISKADATATLYKDGKLQWHQVFKYETAEDIAYQLRLALKLHHMAEDTPLQVSATNPDSSETINYLTQYFPHLLEGDNEKPAGDPSWIATVYLLQQLYTCAL